MKRVLLAASVVGVLSACAAAQKSVDPPLVAQLKVATSPRAVVMGGPTVKGAPYSAEEVNDLEQILGDGTRIHNENRTKVYRDGEGRVRRETPERITISDPVAGVSYFLDPNAMTARKVTISFISGGRGGAFTSVAGTAGGDAKLTAERTMKMSAGTGVTSSAGVGVGVGAGVGGGVTGGVAAAGPKIFVDSSPEGAAKLAAELDMAKMQMATISGGDFNGAVSFNRVETRSAGPGESLGTQMIDGVAAEGTRNTTTIEAGKIGNDRPLTIVSERWYSPELHTMMMTSHSDPRSGKNTFRLTHVSRSDPDPALFQLPSGYQLLEK